MQGPPGRVICSFRVKHRGDFCAAVGRLCPRFLPGEAAMENERLSGVSLRLLENPGSHCLGVEAVCCCQGAGEKPRD